MDRVPYAAFFPFIHPKDADALSLTCKVYRAWILDEYKRVGRDVVLPGGIWHHHLCKRARESVASSKPNTRLLALGSLVDNQCIVCRKRLLAKVSFWGFAAHARCIRGFLLNTYYIPDKLGLDAIHLRILPQETLRGYSVSSWDSYSYQVVFQGPSRRMVPREWTLEHAASVYQNWVHAYFSKKRKAAEAVRKAEEAKRRRQTELVEKREAALAKRRAMLANHELAPTLQGVHLAMGRRLVGDFLDPLVRCKTTLKDVVDLAKRYAVLLEVLHPEDIRGPNDDVSVVVREKVALRLQSMIQKIGPPVRPVRYRTSPFGVQCQSCKRQTAAGHCPHRLCGSCCQGCNRHAAKRHRNTRFL